MDDLLEDLKSRSRLERGLSQRGLEKFDGRQTLYPPLHVQLQTPDCTRCSNQPPNIPELTKMSSREREILIIFDGGHRLALNRHVGERHF